MKSPDALFERLFPAAAKADEPIGPPPASLSAAVVSRWRAGPASGTEGAVVLSGLFRRAAICAGAIMLLSVGWGWLQTRGEKAGAPALAHYAMTIPLPP